MTTTGWFISGNNAIQIGTPPFTGTGLAHMTSGTIDGTAYLGTANQLVATNNAGTDTTWFTAVGDVSYASGSFTVTGLQGRPVASTAPTTGLTLVWNSGASQWQPSSVITLTGGASPVTLMNISASGLVGTTSAIMGMDSSNTFNIGFITQCPTSGTANALQLVGQQAASGTSAGGGIQICSGQSGGSGGANNGSITLYLGGVPGVANTFIVVDGGGVSRTAGAITWSLIGNPTLGQTSSSVATGANFVIAPQVSTNANGTPGLALVNLGAPTGSGTESYFGVCRGGAVPASNLSAALGPQPGGGSTVSSLWLNAPGFTPSASNYTIAGTATLTQFNAPSGGTMFFGVGNSATMALTSTSLAMGVAVGGYSTLNMPFSFTSQSVSAASSITLSNSQYNTPFILFNNTLGSSTVTITFPNTSGGFWCVNTQAITFSTNTLKLQSGTGVGRSVSLTSSNNKNLIVLTDGSNNLDVVKAP